MAIVNGVDNKSTVKDGIICGGTGNTVSGFGSFISNGINNTASGVYSFLGGNGNEAYRFYSNAFGNDNIVSGLSAFICGGNNEIYSDYSVAFGAFNVINNNATTAIAVGDANEVSEQYGCAIGSNNKSLGIGSFASGIGAIANFPGEWARSGAGAVTTDQNQYGFVDYWTATTNASSTEIRISSTNSQRFTIDNNTAVRFRLNIIAKNSSTHAVKEWESTGLIKNVGGTTSMVGSSTASAFGDVAMASASVAVSADNTNDSLKIDVTGIAATNIDWYGRLEYVKIAG